MRESFERVVEELRVLTRDGVKIKIEALDAKSARGDPELLPAQSSKAPAPKPNDPGDAHSFLSFQPDDDSDGPDEPDFDSEDWEDELEPDPYFDAEDEIDVVKIEPVLPSDPRLKEDAWEWAPTAVDPVVLAGEHPVWKLNGGFAKSSQGDYRFRLRWMCSTPEPTPTTNDAGGDLNDVGDVVDPKGDVFDTRYYTYHGNLIRIRRDFIKEILVTVEQIRASGVL